MPCQLFSHICGERIAYRPEPVCDDCGESGERAWHLDTNERMARFQYVYALKPTGPHRALAEWLLGGLRTPCPRCNWIGLLTLEGGTHWRVCPTCEGTGSFWKASEEDVDAVRQAILLLFPNAAAAPIAGFLPGAARNSSLER